MWKNKIEPKLREWAYDLYEFGKTWAVGLTFVTLTILIFVLIKVCCSSTRTYIHLESKKFFRINRITGLFRFIYGLRRDISSEYVLVEVTVLEENKLISKKLELPEFMEDYTAFKIATKNEELLYGFR